MKTARRRHPRRGYHVRGDVTDHTGRVWKDQEIFVRARSPEDAKRQVREFLRGYGPRPGQKFRFRRFGHT